MPKGLFFSRYPISVELEAKNCGAIWSKNASTRDCTRSQIEKQSRKLSNHVFLLLRFANKVATKRGPCLVPFSLESVFSAPPRMIIAWFIFRDCANRSQEK